MALPTRHLLHQGPVIAALGRTAMMAVAQRLDGGGGTAEVPGRVFAGTLAPRPRDLVRDAVRWAGGNPSAYKKTLPHWLFPQWGFPLLARTLEGIPYPLTRVLNAGCQVKVRAPIPQGEPLHVTAQLTGIDDDGRRAVLHQKLVTGTDASPEALVVEFQALVPLGGGKGKDKPRGKRDRPRVPQPSRELARRRFGARSGLEFALLTGDFNPVHWIAPYARAAGFRNTILHGFGTLAFAVEGLNRAVFAGDPQRLSTVGVRFTRPLILPRKVGLYTDTEGGLFVGEAPGGPAYMAGTFTMHDPPEAA